MTDLVAQPVTEEIKDFSRSLEPVSFTVNGDTFQAPGQIPAQTLLDFSKSFEGLGEKSTLEDSMNAFRATLRMVLLPESYERFSARMADPAKPISMDQINEIIPWLMERYGLRPTEPSGDSSTGQSTPEPGTPSTETQPVTESTSAVSQPIDS